MSGSTHPLRVVLVDDHAVVRDGYRAVIAGCPDLQLVAEAADGESALRMLETLGSVDVVVLDLSLPGLSGLETCRRLLRRNPRVRVLVFSMHDDAVLLQHAQDAGAHGYVNKGADTETLIAAIQHVGNGGVHWDARMARTGSSSVQISPIDLEILRLYAGGRTPPEIAASLHISVKTVHNHMSALRKRLGVANQAELALYAMRNGLVQN